MSTNYNRSSENFKRATKLYYRIVGFCCVLLIVAIILINTMDSKYIDRASVFLAMIAVVFSVISVLATILFDNARKNDEEDESKDKEKVFLSVLLSINENLNKLVELENNKKS